MLRFIGIIIGLVKGRRYTRCYHIFMANDQYNVLVNRSAMERDLRRQIRSGLLVFKVVTIHFEGESYGGADPNA